MNMNLISTMAARAARTAISTQTGFALLNFAPVALKAPALAAVAAGGAAMGAVDYYCGRTGTSASRRATAQNDESTHGLAGFLHTEARPTSFSHSLGSMLRTGVEAVLGSAALGIAGVSGVLPVGLAFHSAMVGLPIATVGFALAFATLCWLLPPTAAVPSA